jgi:hypothetical protein
MQASSLAALESGKIQVSPTTLSIQDEEFFSFQETKELLDQIWLFTEAGQWWQIDLLIWAKKRFPELYLGLLDGTRWSYHTAMNLIWMGENVPSHARVNGMSIAHHMEVAPAHILVEKKREWLEMAKELGWTRDELRYHIRGLPSGDEEERGPWRPVNYQSAIHLVLDWLDEKVSYSRDELKQVLTEFMEDMERRKQ